MTVRPRRSALYMPASNARAMEKARSLPVDAIILDLEDAVAPDAKPSAREQAVAAVQAGGFGAREIFIRVNALDTPWGTDDFTAAAHAAPDGILIPKVSRPDLLEGLGRRLLDMQVDHRTRLWAMIETPLAILRVHELAAMARDSETRLTGFVMGTNDLVKEARGRSVPGRAPLIPWLAQTIAAARAYGLIVLDGVFNDFADIEGLAVECAQARDMGFDGKTLIHPRQIEPCNAAFTPSAAEIAEAKKIIAAFERPENNDKGVVQVEGRMIERLHADMAQRTIKIAKAIEAI